MWKGVIHWKCCSFPLKMFLAIGWYDFLCFKFHTIKNFGPNFTQIHNFGHISRFFFLLENCLIFPPDQTDCVNLLVSLNSMCLNVPTRKESLFILVEKVIICLFVCLICLPSSTLRVNILSHLGERKGFHSMWILVWLFRTPHWEKE